MPMEALVVVAWHIIWKVSIRWISITWSIVHLVKMKRSKVTHRVYSNVTPADYRKLQAICKDYGFKSIYQLLQTLLRCLLRHTGQAPEPEEYSMGNEINEMFEEMMEPSERQKYYATYRGRKEQ